MRRKKRGKPVPSLDNKPELQPYLVYIFDIFNELSKRRPFYTSGPGAIQISEIVAYFSLMELVDDFDYRMYLFRMINAMDTAWLAKYNEIAERNKAKQ